MDYETMCRLDAEVCGHDDTGMVILTLAIIVAVSLIWKFVNPRACAARRQARRDKRAAERARSMAAHPAGKGL